MPDDRRMPGALLMGIALAGAFGIFLLTRTRVPKLVSITLTPSSLSLLVNEQVQLQATFTYEGSYIVPPTPPPATWVSTSPTVATVDGLGRVKGTGVGVTQITASVGDVTSSPALVTVTGILGDVNADGVVNVFDQIMVENAIVGNIILTPDQFNRADMNRDGVVDIRDAVIIAEIVASGPGAKLQGIMVTPDMAVIRAGQSQQFNAWGLI